jgi:hypothetical protein
MLARIHIRSNWDMYDEDVFVEIDLPYPLQVGHCIYLKTESLEQLKQMATASREIAYRYFPDWFDRKSRDLHFEEANLDDLDFQDAMIIRYISYTEGAPYVNISLVSYEEPSDADEIKHRLTELLLPQRQAAALKNKTAALSSQSPPVNDNWWKFQNKTRHR